MFERWKKIWEKDRLHDFFNCDASRNRTINDASVIQDKDYTFLQSKQTLNRCARVPLQFRWNKQTVFFARESRGCKEINEHRIEIERRLRTMMITIRVRIFLSAKLLISIFFFLFLKKSRFDIYSILDTLLFWLKYTFNDFFPKRFYTWTNDLKIFCYKPFQDTFFCKII